MNNRPVQEVEQHEPQLSVMQYMKTEEAHVQVSMAEMGLKLESMFNGGEDLMVELKLAMLDEAHQNIHHMLNHHAGEAKAGLEAVSENVAAKVGVDQTARNNERYAALGFFARNNASDSELSTTEELSLDSREATPVMRRN